MNTSRDNLTVAKPLAPEDVRVGAFVTLHSAVHEVPSWLWCDNAASLAPDELVRFVTRARGAGTPLRVKATCLPYVLVKTPSGKCRILDLRSVRIVQLDHAFASLAWTALKAQAQKRKREKDKTDEPSKSGDEESNDDCS